MDEKRKPGICWAKDCTAKYEVRWSVKVKDSDGYSTESTFNACREHFLPEWPRLRDKFAERIQADELPLMKCPACVDWVQRTKQKFCGACLARLEPVRARKDPSKQEK